MTLLDPPAYNGVISFSLFGDNPRYCLGAIENAKLASHIYPGWTVRFYFDETVPFDIINTLCDLNVDLVMQEKSKGLSGMFWRFLVADDDNYSRWIVRDADSRLCQREREAVDQWIISGYTFHCMHDHPAHQMPILGGLFGGKRNNIVNFKEEIERWDGNGRYMDDEDFLEKIIWPKIKHKTLIHAGYESSLQFDCGLIMPFPSKRRNEEFVGATFIPKYETSS